MKQFIYMFIAILIGFFMPIENAKEMMLVASSLILGAVVTLFIFYEREIFKYFKHKLKSLRG